MSFVILCLLQGWAKPLNKSLFDKISSKTNIKKLSHTPLFKSNFIIL
jgi:hypothetical protein